MVCRIVLIDDDPEDLELMLEAVKEVNSEAECDMYRDPCEAIAALKTRLFVPELIIIDLTMPHLSGIECLKQLKELHHLYAVKFVMYSSAHPPKDLLDSLTLAGAIVFKKPSSVNELNHIIKELMS